MLRNCVFGTYRAPATKTSFSSVTSANLIWSRNPSGLISTMRPLSQAFASRLGGWPGSEYDHGRANESPKADMPASQHAHLPPRNRFQAVATDRLGGPKTRRAWVAVRDLRRVRLSVHRQSQWQMDVVNRNRCHATWLQ